MPIRLQKWITRADLRANPNTLYVFGDNLARVGYGGQAKEMRGEPNAVGIPTKINPYKFASDSIAFPFIKCWAEAFFEIEEQLLATQTDAVVVWPADGIGTGLANMKTHAPILWQTLELLRTNLFRRFHANTD